LAALLQAEEKPSCVKTAAIRIYSKAFAHGLGGRGHWLDMLGGSEGKINASLTSGKTVACR
jgi:hypothetical protein